jgi:hypothetical protein
VERWLPHANLRHDLFGCIDLLAVKPGVGALGVQTTTASNLAARQRKAIGLPELRIWLEAGCAFELHGWGKRNGGWYVRRIAVRLDDVPVPVLLAAPPRRRRARKGERQGDLFGAAGAG